MAEPNAAEETLSPQAALARLPGLGSARVRELLADGVSARSYRIESQGRELVLRVDKPLAAQLELHRAAECEILDTVAAAGLGPCPVAFDAVAGLLVTDYVPGRELTTTEFGQPDGLRQVAHLLRRLHALPPVSRRVCPAEAAERYAGLLATPEAQALAADVRRLVDDLPAIAVEPVLCHNDIHPGNLRLTPGGELRLVDWEYAGMTPAGFELAALIGYNGLDADAGALLLEAYGAAPDSSLMVAWQRIFAAVAALWHDVASQHYPTLMSSQQS